MMDIVERLNQKRRAPSHKQGRMPDDEVRYELANPDGPEAATTIASLRAEVERRGEVIAGLCDWIEQEVGADLPFPARQALTDGETK